DREDRVGAPITRIGCAALGLAAAAPLVGEQHLGAVVVERRGMPVGEIGIGCRVEAYRVCRILDVQQHSVAFACTAGVTDAGIDGDVVALRGAGLAAR